MYLIFDRPSSAHTQVLRARFAELVRTEKIDVRVLVSISVCVCVFAFS